MQVSKKINSKFYINFPKNFDLFLLILLQIVFSEFTLPSEGDPELCDIADTLKVINF